MSDQNPWHKLSSKEIYDNPWINIREDKIVHPDGNEGIYGVVHFKNKAIGVLAIDKDGNIVLVGQYRYPLDTYSWEIPEGGCPQDEDPLEAAQRELVEETGLTAKNWKLLGSAHLSNSVSDEIAYWYEATELEEGLSQPEGCEVLELKKVPFAKALNMVMEGEITDSLSVMAIQNYAIKAITSLKK